MKSIVRVFVLGGGSGTYVVARGLRDNPLISLTAGVAVTDNGGSTGRLRKELDVPAFGDLRHVLEALITDPLWKAIVRFRFTGLDKPPIREVAGHVSGNIMLAALQKIKREEFIDGLLELHQKLGIASRHRVLPITLDNVDLVAKYPNGTILHGEMLIGDKNENPIPPTSISILPDYAEICKECVQAIAEADLIIFPPGSLVTSIMAALLPRGVREAIRESRARTVMFVNIMTQPGETSGKDINGNELIYKASDFLRIIQDFIGIHMDIVVCNNKRPSESLLEKYAGIHSHVVEYDLEGHKMIRGSQKVIPTDMVYEDEKTRYIRHHFIRLGWLVNRIIAELFDT